MCVFAIGIEHALDAAPRSPERPLKGDEGCKDDPDDSDEGNGAVNVRHNGRRTLRNEKGRRSISSGLLGSKLLAFKNVPSAPVM
jgi:hypothetical protein